MKHNKKKQDLLLLFMGIVCLIVFAVCAVWLLRYYSDYRQEKNMDEELRTLGRQAQTEVVAENDSENAKDGEQEEQDLLQMDASVYQKINADYVAYLYIPDTEIEYPVVQRNNSYYLNHNFYGEKNAHGTIFLDENCGPDVPVLLLHGHHMKDGTMFGSLKQYRDKDFRQVHSEILLDMGEGFDTYEVFAVLQIDLTKEDYFAYEEIPRDADSLPEYLKQMQKNATWYEQPEKEDKLLLLSTCAYGSEDERMVVAAYKK
ncbi:class B sortase [Kineothrix sp. MSJ-39]|uniref:class B sortase n=1 Tax=Kineothrix sp. MSJ-39 TaxID=2841533 RepID=UPI001C0F4E9B|nr:class B sortase [Kineothrix sp. MSJ-39]MBU5430897.1 class B sortase [Kineothrix sp. MSJ-39]